MSEVWSPQSLEDQIKHAILNAMADASVEVGGDGRHFELKIVSAQFEGKRTLAKQRLVYNALNDLMAGSSAPVHAIAKMDTLTPDQV